MSKRKFSAKQIAAQKRFAAMVKAGTLRKGKRKTAKRNPRASGKYVVTWYTPFDQGYRAFASYEAAEKFAMGQQYAMIAARGKLDTKAGRDFYEKLRDVFRRGDRSAFLKFDGDMEIGLKFDTSKGLRASRSTAPTIGPDAKRNPVKAGARRSPPKRNPHYAGKYVVRAQRPVKSGYLYYYLRGDQFVKDAKHADKFGKADGEKHMRAILPKLPRAIASITLVKA